MDHEPFEVLRPLTQPAARRTASATPAIPAKTSSPSRTRTSELQTSDIDGSQQSWQQQQPHKMDLDPRLRPSDRLPSIALSAPNSTTPSPANVGATGGYGLPPLTSYHHNGVERSDTPLSSSAQQHYQHQPQQQQQDDADSGEANNDGVDPKRSRACEACRGLKVRCEPADDDGPCKRCRKAGRKCVVTAPSRKRQKKTDSRVSELEKKIDALTASLQARGQTGGPAGQPSPTGGSEENISPTLVNRQRPSMDEQSGYPPSHDSPGSMMGPPERTSVSSTPTRREPPAFQPPMVMAGMKRKASDRRSTMEDDRRESPKQTSSPWVRPDQGDIIDRGIISMDVAADLFARYTERMAPHLPAVIFPPSQTAAELRRSKPILFLAVMAAAGSEMHSLQTVLQRELMTIFAEKVFLSGEKSLEIVQALLVAVIWYWPPEHFEELKFYQLVHVAAVMAIDIGLGRKGPQRRPMGSQYSWQSHSFRRQAPLDPSSIECRRAWLGCYFLTCNTSMSLHRPNLVRWTPFMSECIDILNSSPDAAPTDKYFCHLVMQHQLGEEICGQFSLDDPANVVDINDARTQYALKALERDLEKAKNSVPEDLLKPTLKIGWNMVSLYLHEVALHTKTAPDQLRPPFNTDNFTEGVVGSEPLSAAHISAISSCLSAVDAVFTTFLSMDIAEIRCLPVYNFVRVAYGIVILVKMYFSASSPNSELGKVISKGNLRVEYFLDALLDKFRSAAADEKSRPASKFLVVLAMLKSWFLKQEKQETNKDAQGRPDGQDTQQPANTPLQLLSEVAAGSENSRGDPRAAFSHLSSLRQPQQPFFHDPATTGATPSSTGSSSDVHGQQQQTPLPPFCDPSVPYQQQMPPMDMSLMGGGMLGNLGLDFAGLGFQPESQEDGAKIMLAEPWFSDVFQGFQGMQDNNMFPF